MTAPLASSGVLYHLPNSVTEAYGAPTGFNLSTPTGLLGYVIRFVNGPRRRIRADDLHAGPATLPIGREQLGALLHSAVHGPAHPGDIDPADPSDADLRAISTRAENQIRWMHALDRAPAGAVWQHHAYVLGFDGFFALVAGLLMDSRVRAEVAQCRHAPCGRYFLVPDRSMGRPQRLYCCTAHRIAVNDAGARDRQRARRQRARVTRELLDKGIPRLKAVSAVAQAYKELPTATDAALARLALKMLKEG